MSVLTVVPIDTSRIHEWYLEPKHICELPRFKVVIRTKRVSSHHALHNVQLIHFT